MGVRLVAERLRGGAGVELDVRTTCGRRRIAVERHGVLRLVVVCARVQRSSHGDSSVLVEWVCAAQLELGERCQQHCDVECEQRDIDELVECDHLAFGERDELFGGVVVEFFVGLAAGVERERVPGDVQHGNEHVGRAPTFDIGVARRESFVRVFVIDDRDVRLRRIESDCAERDAAVWQLAQPAGIMRVVLAERRRRVERACVGLVRLECVGDVSVQRAGERIDDSGDFEVELPRLGVLGRDVIIVVLSVCGVIVYRGAERAESERAVDVPVFDCGVERHCGIAIVRERQLHQLRRLLAFAVVGV